jgi:hypothetical protein
MFFWQGKLEFTETLYYIIFHIHDSLRQKVSRKSSNPGTKLCSAKAKNTGVLHLIAMRSYGVTSPN